MNIFRVFLNPCLTLDDQKNPSHHDPDSNHSLTILGNQFSGGSPSRCKVSAVGLSGVDGGLLQARIGRFWTVG
jgi:hypothetical protein